LRHLPLALHESRRRCEKSAERSFFWAGLPQFQEPPQQQQAPPQQQQYQAPPQQQQAPPQQQQYGQAPPQQQQARRASSPLATLPPGCWPHQRAIDRAALQQYQAPPQQQQYGQPPPQQQQQARSFPLSSTPTGPRLRRCGLSAALQQYQAPPQQQYGQQQQARSLPIVAPIAASFLACIGMRLIGLLRSSIRPRRSSSSTASSSSMASRRAPSRLARPGRPCSRPCSVSLIGCFLQQYQAPPQQQYGQPPQQQYGQQARPPPELLSLL
jgi:hypothetical protein